MTEFIVRWEIDLLAEDPFAAASLALRVQKDPKSIATCFVVTDSETGNIFEIDCVAKN